MSKKLNSASSMDECIEGIRMRKSDREIAKAHMREADVVVDLILRAAESLRSAEVLFARLYQRIQTRH